MILFYIAQKATTWYSIILFVQSLFNFVTWLSRFSVFTESIANLKISWSSLRERTVPKSLNDLYAPRSNTINVSQLLRTANLVKYRDGEHDCLVIQPFWTWYHTQNMKIIGQMKLGICIILWIWVANELWRDFLCYSSPWVLLLSVMMISSHPSRRRCLWGFLSIYSNLGWSVMKYHSTRSSCASASTLKLIRILKVAHRIPKLKCFSSCLVIVFAQPLQPGVKSRMKM